MTTPDTKAIRENMEEINAVKCPCGGTDEMCPCQNKLHAISTVKSAEIPRAWQDVMDERGRQMAVEGRTPEHDDCYLMAELAQAAACYAISGTPADEARYIHGRLKYHRDLFWPFSRDWWKPTDRRRNLVKAGALILAEIERLDRAALTQKETDHDR